MNYYQFHIGDFNSATRHLTIVERSLYRDLIDMYYDTEQAINASDFDRLARRLMCRTDDEKTALQYVLDEFFTLDGDLYTHERCECEIQEYQAKREQQSRAGKASAEKRLSKKSTSDDENQTSVKGNLTDVERSLNDPSTNHKPLTINQEPLTNDLKTHTLAPDENSPSEILNLWNPNLKQTNDFLKMSGLPVFTQHEFDRFRLPFLSYYADQINNGLLQTNKLNTKMVQWIKSDYKNKDSPQNTPKYDHRNVNDVWKQPQERVEYNEANLPDAPSDMEFL